MAPHRNPTHLIREILHNTKQLPTIAALIKQNPPQATYGTQATTGTHTTNAAPSTPTEKAALNPTPQDQAINSITQDLQITKAALERITLNARRLQYATTHTPPPPDTQQHCQACNKPATPPRSARGQGPLCTNCAQSWRTANQKLTYTEWSKTRS